MKIFLLGMMGSGKSYWMKKLGSELALPQVDLDRLIEKSVGKSISEMFAQNGEAQFREAESATLRSLANMNDAIIATGGGTPCFHDNIDWMNKNGVTIWLDEDTEQLVQQLKPGKAHRPLIAHLADDELKDYLEAKKRERSSFYSQAHYRLTGNDINQKRFLEIIENQ